MQAKKRKLYFRALKRIMRVRYPKPRFVFLGKPLTTGAIVLSNHEGTDAPMALEIYYDAPMRMWGAHEMNEGLPALYRYQTKVYYHQKKHWNLWLARLFCLIASPLTYLFYSGLDLISTYPDMRLVKTIKESIVSLQAGDNIIIFPEHSENGYLAELAGFYTGFVLLAERCAKQGIDVPIYVAYFCKSDNTYLFDAPIPFSELSANGNTREQIAQQLLQRCNALGRHHKDPAAAEPTTVA